MENEVINIMKNMHAIFESASEDAHKFAEGNNSAGTRVRESNARSQELSTTR
jgi:hypothetical protein